MAVTLQSNPAVYSSMHDELWFVVSSTNSTTNNFKYVFDVVINSQVVARVKTFPDPVSNYGIFNASPIVRAFVTNYFEPSGTGILAASNDKLKVDYTIEIREDLNGSIAVLPDLQGSFSAYNFYPPLLPDILAVKQNIPLILSDYYDNLLIDNFTDDWLTERDTDEIIIEYGDTFFATWFKITNANYSINIDTYDAFGSLVATESLPLIITGEFNLFNLQAGHINSSAGSNIITENTFAYNVYMTSDVIGYESRKLKFFQRCYPKYRQYNIHFLNRLGGWDTMKFALVNKRKTNFTRSQFRRNEWQLVGNEMLRVDEYNRYNETMMNFAIQHKDSYMLTSDWVNEQDYTWLSQLVGSTISYMEILGGYFPVTITQSDYQYKLTSVDKLFNFEIEVEVGQLVNSQFR